jgi:hypothetical protein
MLTAPSTTSISRNPPESSIGANEHARFSGEFQVIAFAERRFGAAMTTPCQMVETNRVTDGNQEYVRRAPIVQRMTGREEPPANR